MLKFDQDDDTRVVNELLGRIRRVFASDQIDGDRLMVWREEQRAIGELMHAAEGYDSVHVIGFSTFLDQHSSRFAPWLSSFERDIQARGTVQSPRLAELQELLGRLVAELKKGRSTSADDAAGSARWRRRAVR